MKMIPLMYMEILILIINNFSSKCQSATDENGFSVNLYNINDNERPAQSHREYQSAIRGLNKFKDYVSQSVKKM